MTEPRGPEHVGISDKIALLIKMLEQLYPFGDRPRNLDKAIRPERMMLYGDSVANTRSHG